MAETDGIATGALRQANQSTWWRLCLSMVAFATVCLSMCLSANVSLQLGVAAMSAHG